MGGTETMSERSEINSRQWSRQTMDSHMAAAIAEAEAGLS